MKKILVTTALCLVTAASVMAQGRVNFANSSATPIRINNGSIDANNVVVAGPTTAVLGTASTAFFGIGPASTRIQLFAGATTDSMVPVLIGTATPTPTALFVTNSASLTALPQGSFAGGTVVPLTGSPLFLQFTAVSINGLYRGISSIIQVTPALSPAAATILFSATPTASQWNGITMYAVPEPSSMALAGIGAASLLMFRRRK